MKLDIPAKVALITMLVLCLIANSGTYTNKHSISPPDAADYLAILAIAVTASSAIGNAFGNVLKPKYSIMYGLTYILVLFLSRTFL